MTTAQQWLDLAERIEAATGPDREIDAALHLAATSFEPRIAGPGWTPESQLVVPMFPGWAPLPAYTRSIDEAMKLVPEGWDGAIYLATDSHGPCVQLETPAMRERFSMDYEGAEGKATTPALALAAAACRARAGIQSC